MTKNSNLALLLYKDPLDPFSEIQVRTSKLSNVQAIGDLFDVTFTNLQNGEFLIWDNTSGSWVNQQGPTFSLAGFAEASYVNDAVKDFLDMPVFITEDTGDKIVGETEFKDYDYVNLVIDHQFQAYPRILPTINSASFVMSTTKGDFDYSMGGFRREVWERDQQYGFDYWKDPFDKRHWQRRWIPIEDDNLLIQTGELKNINQHYYNNEEIAYTQSINDGTGPFTETNYLGRMVDVPILEPNIINDPYGDSGQDASGIIGRIDNSHWKLGDYLANIEKQYVEKGLTKFQPGDTFYIIQHGRLPETAIVNNFIDDFGTGFLRYGHLGESAYVHESTWPWNDFAYLHSQISWGSYSGGWASGTLSGDITFRYGHSGPWVEGQNQLTLTNPTFNDPNYYDWFDYPTAVDAIIPNKYDQTIPLTILRYRSETDTSHNLESFGFKYKEGLYSLGEPVTLPNGLLQYNDRFDSYEDVILPQQDHLVFETDTSDSSGNSIAGDNIVEEELTQTGYTQQIVQDTLLGSVFHGCGWITIGDFQDTNVVNGIKKIEYPNLTYDSIIDAGSLGTSDNIFLANDGDSIADTFRREYENLPSTTSGSGTGATFSVVVKIPSTTQLTSLDNQFDSGNSTWRTGKGVGFPIRIVVNNVGKDYQVGDFIKIEHASWDGDLIFKVEEVLDDTVNFNVTEAQGEIHTEAWEPILSYGNASGMPRVGFPSWHHFSDPNWILADIFHFRPAAVDDYPDGVLMDFMVLKSHYEHPNINTMLLDSTNVQLVDSTKLLVSDPPATNFNFVQNDNDLWDTLGDLGSSFGITANTHFAATDNITLESKTADENSPDSWDSVRGYLSYSTRSAFKSLYKHPSSDMWSASLKYQIDTGRGRAQGAPINGLNRPAYPGDAWGGAITGGLSQSSPSDNFLNNINPYTGVNVGTFGQVRVHGGSQGGSYSNGARAPQTIVEEGRFWRDTWGLDLNYYQSNFPIYDTANTANRTDQIRNSKGEIIFEKPMPPWEDIITTSQVDELILLENGTTGFTVELSGYIHVQNFRDMAGYEEYDEKAILTYSGTGVTYGTYDPTNDITQYIPDFGIGKMIRVLSSSTNPNSVSFIRKVIDVIDIEDVPGQVVKGYILEAAVPNPFTNRNANCLDYAEIIKMELQILHSDYFNFLSRQDTRTFIADGDTRIYGVPHTPGNIDVWVNGIYQTPEMPYSHRTTDYWIHGDYIKTIWNKHDTWGTSSVIFGDEAGNNNSSDYGYGEASHWNLVGYNDSNGGGEHSGYMGGNRASNFEQDWFCYNNRKMPFSHQLDFKTQMTAQYPALPYGEWDYASVNNVQIGRTITANEITSVQPFTFQFLSWNSSLALGTLDGASPDWDQYHPWTQFHPTPLNISPIYRIVDPAPSSSSTPSYYYFEAINSGDNIRKPRYLTGTQITWTSGIPYTVDKVYYSEPDYEHFLRGFEYNPETGSSHQTASVGWNGDILKAPNILFHMAPPAGAVIKVRIY